MQKIIGVTELQRNFRAVFDEVARGHIPYILTRGSRPEAAIIPSLAAGRKRRDPGIGTVSGRSNPA